MDRLTEEEEGVLGSAEPMGGCCESEYALGGSLPPSNVERKCSKGIIIFMMSSRGRGEQALHSQSQMASHYKRQTQRGPTTSSWPLESPVGEILRVCKTHTNFTFMHSCKAHLILKLSAEAPLSCVFVWIHF